VSEIKRSCSSCLRLFLSLALMSAIASFGAPRITEFMAANDSALADENGEFSDWIEIHNPDTTPISLAGYFLTENATNLHKWTFPTVTLNPGAYWVVFASGKNRADPAGQLHTDFQLSADGIARTPPARSDGTGVPVRVFQKARASRAGRPCH